MLPVPMMHEAKEAFCWGTYEVTVDVGPRIRLPASVLRALQGHQVERIWIYPDPTGPRLILCPDSSRESYMKVAVENLPKGWTTEEGIRRFICTGESVALRKHGRIPIGCRYPREFSVTAGTPVVIVGTGLWYELWRHEDWPPSPENPEHQRDSMP